MDKCKNHKTFPSELVEYSYLLISLLSTNSKIVILWPWPHICSLLHLFTIESWSVTVHNLPFYFFFLFWTASVFSFKTSEGSISKEVLILYYHHSKSWYCPHIEDDRKQDCVFTNTNTVQWNDLNYWSWQGLQAGAWTYDLLISPWATTNMLILICIEDESNSGHKFDQMFLHWK